MANLKVGDRVRWKVTSNAILTVVKGERAEVTAVLQDRDGPVTIFRNLEGPGEHTFAYEGEINESHFERID